MFKCKVALATLALALGAVQPLVPLAVLALTSESTLGAELPIQNGGIQFVGEASPGAQVTFKRNGAVIGTEVALVDSSFDRSFGSEPLGDATYSLYATDLNGRNSATVSYDVTILPIVTTTLSGIFLPTTFQLASNSLKRSQIQTASGTTRQDSTITTFWSGAKYGESFSSQVPSSASGNWSSVPGQTLHLGSYAASAIVQKPGGALSPQTPPASFQVVLSADLNNDNRVNLTDFSILMFFYLQTNINKPADINDDLKTNLTDFSIMLFFWTG